MYSILWFRFEALEDEGGNDGSRSPLDSCLALGEEEGAGSGAAKGFRRGQVKQRSQSGDAGGGRVSAAAAAELREAAEAGMRRRTTRHGPVRRAGGAPGRERGGRNGWRGATLPPPLTKHKSGRGGEAWLSRGRRGQPCSRRDWHLGIGLLLQPGALCFRGTAAPIVPSRAGRPRRGGSPSASPLRARKGSGESFQFGGCRAEGSRARLSGGWG